MSADYTKIFFDILDTIGHLTKEEQGQILLGMVTYSITGEEPELTGNAYANWPIVKLEMEREAESAKGFEANESKPEASESKTEANESKTEAIKSKPEFNGNSDAKVGQDYDYDYDYLIDDDLRAYARQADVIKCFKEFIGRPPTPGDVITLVEKAMSCDFEPSVLAFAIEKSAHADNPVLYAREMMNRWDLRDIRTLGDAANAYYSKSCKVEDKGYDDIPF